MEKLRILLLAALLLSAAFAEAQEAPVPAQGQPQQQPVITDPAVDRKTEFNAPQSPNRKPNVPSEDTLIKGQTSSGAVIQDSLVPSSDRKQERMNSKKTRKGTAERGDTTSAGNGKDPAIKP